MSFSPTLVIYALVFLAAIAIVEAVYLLVRSLDKRDIAVNRRMKIVDRGDTQTVNPSLVRQQLLGGPISQKIFESMPQMERAFMAANLKISPGRAIVISIAVFVVLLTLLIAVGRIPFMLQILIAAVFAFGIPFLILQAAVGKQRKAFNDQLPDAINLITRGLQAGHPVPVALGLVAREMDDPIGTQFGTALDEINFGKDRSMALRDIGERFPNPEFLFFIAAIEMQRESGGNLVEVLDNLTRVIRERSNMKKKALAVSAEGRLTAIMVGALPYILFAFLFLTNPALITGAASDPLFFPLMGGAWVLWLIGIIIIWRMVDIKV